MNKSSSSSSDWDSMPEEPYESGTNKNNDTTVQVQTIKPSLKEQTSPELTSDVKVERNNGSAMKFNKGDDNNGVKSNINAKLPPFDFGSEVQREAKLAEDKSENSKRVRRPGKELPRRRSAYRPSTMNSGKVIKDTSDESDETWTPRKKGQDNLAFVTEEKADNNGESNDKDDKMKPRPEESVAIFVFEQPSNGYMTSSEYGSPSLYSDRVLRLIANPLKRVCAEFLGILRLPLHLMLIILGQIIFNVFEGLLRPLTEHLLKPIMISVHNLLLMPLCVSLNQIVGLGVFAIAPCAKICCCGANKKSGEDFCNVKTV